VLQELRSATSTIRVTVAASVLLVFSSAGLAQSPPANTAPATPAVTPTPDYHPSLGDLMTMAVQPRHTKLGLAGQARNWPYAQYELSELRNALARNSNPGRQSLSGSGFSRTSEVRILLHEGRSSKLNRADLTLSRFLTRASPRARHESLSA
jgi:hypothetical protein